MNILIFLSALWLWSYELEDVIWMYNKRRRIKKRRDIYKNRKQQFKKII